jgi:hypothetical protein
MELDMRAEDRLELVDIGGVLELVENDQRPSAVVSAEAEREVEQRV